MPCPLCGGTEFGESKLLRTSFGFWTRVRGRACLRCGWLALYIGKGPFVERPAGDAGIPDANLGEGCLP